MDSRGYIYGMDADRRLNNISPTPVPDPMRGVLVMRALEAEPGPGKRGWWAELAPLTMRERDFVWARLASLDAPAKGAP